MRDETGEKVGTLGKRVASRSETGEPRGLIDKVSETGETIRVIGWW